LGLTNGWEDEASCKGQTSLFFPDEEDPEYRKKIFSAKSICENCTVKIDCLTNAIVNNERVGVWGGMTLRQISRLRNQIGVKDENYVRSYVEEKVFDVQSG